MSKKSRAQLSAENRTLRAHGFGNNIANVLRTAVKYGVYAFIAWQAQVAITNLSGKTTVADIKVDAKGSLGVPEQAPTEPSRVPLWFGTLGLLVGIGGLGYGRMQRRLRQETVERMHPYQELYEKSIDPRRTSSGLTPRGETRREDR